MKSKKRYLDFWQNSFIKFLGTFEALQEDVNNS